MIWDRVISPVKLGDGTEWIDVSGPSSAELYEISQKYAIPRSSIEDCLEPEHFPKFESFTDLNFIMLRCTDESAKADADSVHELTRKIAVFHRNGIIMTIHRSEMIHFNNLKARWREKRARGEICDANSIFLSIIEMVVQSYQKPSEMNRNLLENFETKVFRHDGDTFEEGYFLKRRASAFKRILRMTIDILPRLLTQYPNDASSIQDVKENGERLYAYVEEFYDNITSLVNLQLALSNHRLTVASFKTNEVMRILTVFSVFFMPLNLVTGIYGMNFENIPELKWEHGYFYSLILMFLMTIGIMLYFKKKGVLSPPNNDSADGL